jgi:hypothetical protein
MLTISKQKLQHLKTVEANAYCTVDDLKKEADKVWSLLIDKKVFPVAIQSAFLNALETEGKIVQQKNIFKSLRNLELF